MNRYKIELLFTFLGIFIIGQGVYNIPHKINKIIRDFVNNSTLDNLNMTFSYIIIGLISISIVRLFFLVKAFKKTQFLNLVSLFILVVCCFLFVWKDIFPYQSFLFSCLLVTAYLTYKINVKITVNKENEVLGLDLAIKTQDEDKLNRYGIAKRIYEIINSSRHNSLRIGIYGKWGSGKTSLMNLVKNELGDNYVIGWFNPWVYSDKESLWVGFRECFEHALIKYSDGLLGFTLARKLKYGLLKIIQVNSSKLFVGKLMDKLVQTAGTPVHEEVKRNIESYLDSVLPKDTKIIIFVDDLDRLDDGKQILEILKTLKEIINIKNIYYIVAIDDETVSLVISQEMNVKDGSIFLEKILDYSILVEQPLEVEVHKLLEAELSSLTPLIKKEGILNISGYLPRNPRSLKRFLKNLEIVHPLLNRYSEEELNWNFIYLAQLLKIEFPNIYREILNERQIIELFTFSHQVLLRMDSNNKNKAELLNNDIEKITKVHSIRKEELGRFTELFKGLQENVEASDKDVLFYFRLIEDSGYMSNKEFNGYFTKVNNRPHLINDIFNNDKKIEYVNKLFSIRGNLLGQISDSNYEYKMSYFKKNVDNIDNQINNIISVVSSDVNKMVFNLLFEQFRSWSNFNSDFYIELREREKELLKNIVILISEVEAVSVLVILKPWENDDFFENKPEFFAYKRELIKLIEPIFVKDIIGRFSIEKGISIWKPDEYLNEKWYLFQNSAFQSESENENLFEIAKVNDVVRDNFYEYFRLLKYYISEGFTIVPREKIIELLQNKRFLKLLWESVTSSRINIRMFSSLREFRDIVVGYYDEPIDEILTPPEWWGELEEKYNILVTGRNQNNI